MSTEQAGQAELLPGPATLWLKQQERSRRERLPGMLAAQGLAVLILDCSMYLFWMLAGGFDAARVVPYPQAFIFIGGFPLLWVLLLGWLGGRHARRGLRHYMEQFNRSSPLAWSIGDERVTGGDGGSFQKKLQRLFRELPRRLGQQGIQPDLLTAAARNDFLVAAFALLAGMTALHYTLGVYFEFLVYAALLVYMLQDFRRKLDRGSCELALARVLLGLDDRGQPLPPEDSGSGGLPNSTGELPSGSG